MKVLKLHSCLAAQIQSFISLRQLSGTDYQSQAKLLEYFDRFLVKEKLHQPRVTRQLTERYQHTLSHLTLRVKSNRFCVVRQLCEYLSRTDPLTYVPEPPENHYIPGGSSALLIEGTYLVPFGSLLGAIAEVDREGVRVGISSKSAYDLFLSRTLQHAQLVPAPNPDAAFALLVAGKADVVAGVSQHLAASAEKLPGSRVLEGRFMAIGQAVGIPRGRDAGAKYLREFIEDVKASGLVARAIEKAGVRGVSVAPRAQVQ